MLCRAVFNHVVLLCRAVFNHVVLLAALLEVDCESALPLEVNSQLPACQGAFRSAAVKLIQLVYSCFQLAACTCYT